MKSGARVRLDSDGVVTVETDMTDIGTGSYTIIAQTAAEMMGVPLDKVVVQLGDSGFPGLGRLGRPVGRATARRPASMPPASSCARPWRRSSASTRPTRCSTMARSRAGNRSVPLADAAGEGELVAEDTIEYRRSRQEVPAVDLRRAFRRGRRRCRDRRDPHPAHARGLRRRAHPQPEVGAQPGDRRDDDGRRRGADGGTGGRQAASASSSTTTWPATRCRSMPTSRIRR